VGSEMYIRDRFEAAGGRTLKTHSSGGVGRCKQGGAGFEKAKGGIHSSPSV
jgi:hypothetical protein